MEVWQRIIDYAGVFPPAELSAEQAIQAYEAGRASADKWILGPCMLKASQIAFVDERVLPSELGLVADLSIDGFTPLPELTQIEVRHEAGGLEEIIRLAMTFASIVYIEGPWKSGGLGQLRRLRAHGLDVRAKLRTGGFTPDAFPSPDQVAAFIQNCHDLQVPFKMSAGLHHPFRHASSIPGAVEHGFVNILAAVRAVLDGQRHLATEILEETDPGRFEVQTGSMANVGKEVPAERVRWLFRSFGSCSYQEPVAHLREIGLVVAR